MNSKLQNILNYFSQKYPEPDTALNYSSRFELLIATILSAQTTDKQVNKVTNKLFARYHTPRDFVKLKREELENLIKSLGLYHNKSKYIIEASKILIEEFEGKVPDNRKDLMKLPGVGRKTANVVLTFGFTEDTFPVDTHVFRVANRLGLAHSEQVDTVEQQLMDKIPAEYWRKMHIWFISFGREICKARNPDCKSCKLQQYCNYI